MTLAGVGSTGILGGAFNPPHNGHIALAVSAIEQLDLERILLVPVGTAPHKVVERDPGPDVRLALCEAAVEGIEGVEVDDLEVRRQGPSYTADTVEQIQQRDAESDLVLVLGEDAASAIGSWHEPERIVSGARIAWVSRQDLDTDGGRAEAALDALGATSRRIEMKPVDVSSTLVRERIAAGHSIDALVPAPVSRLIADLGLYSNGVAH
jgi:nicotinate-nucleotide adenylyltransferase